MKIRMKIGVSGTFHGQPDGVKPGDVVDVEDWIGAKYCAQHYAEPLVELKEERAVAPKAEERAKPEPAPEPVAVKPEAAPESPKPAPKPRPGVQS